MITGTSLLKNGRVTGPLPSVKDLVKNKIVHAITASRYWSSSENSQNNSWNVNFSNGNFNNNNKYNSNMVRAVAALNDKYVEGWFDALDDCCAKKKTSSQCVMSFSPGGRCHAQRVVGCANRGISHSLNSVNL